MEYRIMGQAVYVRMDRGDEIIESLLSICRKEGIRSATYSGIGGCASAAIQTFDPLAGAFHTEEKRGMLELVSLMGNIICGADGALHHHTHALFSYVEGGEHRVIAGHLKQSVVLYTAEIELRPADGVISCKRDPETRTGFWSFE